MQDLDLTYFFKTKQQATEFQARLSTIANKLYETNFNLDSALLDEFGLQKKDKFISLLRENKIHLEKSADIKKFIILIQELITKLPVLTLTIAFEPKEKTLQTLAEWFVMNIKKQMLFEIIIDPKLIAGAKLNYKGKFLDASIKPIFDKILSELLFPSQTSSSISTENLTTPPSAQQSEQSVQHGN